MQTTGFDLGIFEEAVRGYASGHAPVVALKGAGFDQLGDHFSPLLAVLAPVYRLFPGAQTLLVAQAVLFALSTVPVTRTAVELLGRARGLAVGLAYGLSWGLCRADLFDFHEVALAVPLAAWSVAALVRGQHRAAVCWALPLLLVKEDQGLLVAGIGVLVWWRGGRRLGAATVLAAVAGTLLAVLVLVPAFNPGGSYTYAANGAWHGDPLNRLLLPEAKWHTVKLLLAPTLFVALRSPLCLLTVLPLAARFWTTNPTYWSTGLHYNAVLMPVLFLALADGLRRLPRWTGPAARAIPALALVLALAHAPRPDLSGPDPQVRQARQVLAVIPDGATVAAANQLAPQLTDRCTVSLFPYLTYPNAAGSVGRPVARWVAALDRPGDFPVPEPDQLTALAALPTAGYRVVAAGGGVTVYQWNGN
ncbi:putative membrane protein [Kitasatospora viridis]|uniref:Putative membrane protein n=2 Tax=Kitasatospora viridis TaxID=281105 RepID=A0A561T6U7_9ACTN|nr:putative membrane protein [Kitasatospora viridis]